MREGSSITRFVEVQQSLVLEEYEVVDHRSMEDVDHARFTNSLGKGLFRFTVTIRTFYWSLKIPH